MSEEAVEGLVVLLNPRRTRTNMKLLQLVWIFLLTLCGQSDPILKPRPEIEGVTAMMVKEDGEAILNCSFSTNIEKTAFDWKKDVDKGNAKDVFFYSDGNTVPGPEFKDRVSHFPDQLRFGNASIKITNAKTSDSGSYTCFHATLKTEIRSVISLTVDPILKDRSPEKIKGASPEPSVTNLDQTQSSALLQCVVRGASPKPEVVWKDSDGNSLRPDHEVDRNTTGNKFDVILLITVTKTDNYTCVATQKEIYHQIHRTIFVRLNGGALKPYISIVEETKDGVLLQCEVFGASPELKVSWRNKAGQDFSSKEQKTENSIILQTTVTKTDYYRCVTTEGKKSDEVYSEFLVPVPEETSVGFMLPFLIGVGVTLGLVGSIGVFLWCRYKKSAGGSRGKQENGYHSTGGISDD